MDNAQIGKFITECRKQKGLTQQQLADKLNLSNKTISKWECGAGSPDLSNLSALANILEVTVDELLKGEKNPPNTDISCKSESKKLSIFSHMTSAQHVMVLIILIASAIGALLGILSYNHGWLG